jgi:coenzyme F420 hydrogenase subunit beta
VSPDEARFYLAWAARADLRKSGASGGVVTALCAHHLQSGRADGAVMVRADENRPLFNRVVVARNADEVAECSGSRYGPASACLGLAEVKGQPGGYVFVGKPCEIEALEGLKGERPALAQSIVLKVGIFCAQTPGRARTARLLEERSLGACDLDRIDYRGEGWPGTFRVTAAGRIVHEESYANAWSFLAARMPALGCFLCADHVAAMADISVGDPWDAPEEADIGEGKSLVVARTPAGAAALEDAVASGALEMVPAGKGLAAGACGRDTWWRETARRRRAVYNSLFGGRVRLKPLFQNGFSGVATILRQRLRRGYY